MHLLTFSNRHGQLDSETSAQPPVDITATTEPPNLRLSVVRHLAMEVAGRHPVAFGVAIRLEVALQTLRGKLHDLAVRLRLGRNLVRSLILVQHQTTMISRDPADRAP